LQYASDYSRVALLLSFGANLRDQSWFLEKGKEGKMQLTWRDTVCAGQGRFPVPTGCTRAWLPAGLLIFFIISAQPLWAQTVSRSSISELIAQNRLDDAEKRLLSILSQQPDQGWALDLMAEIRMRQKRAPEAEALFRRALTLSPNDVQAYRGLGKLYNSLENSRQAIDSYTVDKQKAPQALDDLVQSGYIKVMPIDPFTHRSDTWMPVEADTLMSLDQTQSGIDDVHSGSQETGSDGQPYSSW